MRHGRRGQVWTPEAVKGLGVRTDVPTAGDILAGWCKDESYRAVKRGDFPVPVLQLGRRMVVPVQPILDLLGLGIPPDSESGGSGQPGDSESPGL